MLSVMNHLKEAESQTGANLDEMQDQYEALQARKTIINLKNTAKMETSAATRAAALWQDYLTLLGIDFDQDLTPQNVLTLLELYRIAKEAGR